MKSRYTLAIDNQHIALLKKERHQFLVEHVRTFESHVKPLDILKPMLHRKQTQIVSGLDSKKVILRRLELKLKSRREIMAALPFQMEQHLPFQPEEVIAIPSVKIRKEVSLIDVMATHQQTLDQHIQSLYDSGIDPDVVSTDPTALFRFAEFLYPQQGSLLIYDPKKQLLAAMTDHALVAFQFVPTGEFERTMNFFRKKFPAIEQILTIGPSPPKITLQCLKVENEEWIPYATAIGLALDAAKADEQSHQFLCYPYHSKHKVKKQRKSLMTFFILCFLFCASLVFFSHRYFEKDTRSFLQQMHLPEETSLKSAANSLKLSTQKRKHTPFAPINLPKVHEILAWLSNHPDLQKDIAINHMKYKITKRPKLGAKNRFYEGKVDIEFVTEFPRLARAFHEALEKEQHFIDKHHEICFSVDHNLYKISFYMKRRNQ